MNNKRVGAIGMLTLIPISCVAPMVGEICNYEIVSAATQSEESVEVKNVNVDFNTMYDKYIDKKMDAIHAEKSKKYYVKNTALADEKTETSTENECEEENNQNYTNEELMLLAGIIENEAGSDYCTDYHQYCVASVVLNRVKNNDYPDTIDGVIFQRNQYAINNRILNNPSNRAIENAKYILDNGSILPDGCVFQSEFRQGDYTYDVIRTVTSTTYICGKY